MAIRSLQALGTLVALAVWSAPATATEEELVPPPAPAKETSAASEAGAASETPAPGEASAATEAPAPTASEGRVARATFTTDVIDREPADSVEALTNDHGLVYFFTELRGLEGQTVVHRWEWNGQTMAEVPFEVRGPRWRVHSSKNLEPDWLGEWSVSVIDASGRVLERDSLRFRELSAAPAPAEPETPAAPAAPAP